jgi:hypothetical protein
MILIESADCVKRMPMAEISVRITLGTRGRVQNMNTPKMAMG